MHFQNFRDLFVDHIRHCALVTRANIGEPLGHDAIAGAEGVVRALQHGQVIFGVTHADEDLFPQIFLQIPGGAKLGYALGVQIQNSCAGTEQLQLVAPFFLDIGAGLVEQFLLVGVNWYIVEVLLSIK